MQSVILYSTGCPRCKVLKAKMDAKGISYEEKSDIDEMEALGIETVPVLRVGDDLMMFTKAMQWVMEKDGTSDEE